MPRSTSSTPRIGLLVAALSALLVLAAVLPAGAGERASAAVSLVEVELPDAAARDRLVASGLDVVEVEDAATAEVMLHSAAEARTLDRLGLRSRIVEADVSAGTRQARRAEAERAARLAVDVSAASSLPTGRVSYRTLAETEAELRAIARANRDRVALLELPEPSLLGRPVLGLRISRDPSGRSGRPAFLNSGMHHSREWPTVEFTAEFAHDVLAADGTDPRVTALLDAADLLIVPIVNPDGYHLSRSGVQEQKRKNCRVVAGETPTYEECADPDNFSFGVDLNRNYGGFFGGPGSSTNVRASNHHGAAPFSEPEIRNMRALATSHQVTVAINNHTPDERLLRAPSASNEPIPADVDAYDALAQELGAVLDWPAGPWTEIYYEASGTAEQTAYYGAGTFAFTPEATPGHSGAARFHPPYEFVVDQYWGTGAYEGSSIREAFLVAWEAAGDASQHAVITGEATPGAELTVTKTFTLDTSPFTPTPGGPEVVLDVPMHYESTMTVPADGEFRWHVNPSLRPSQYLSSHLRESWTLSCEARSRRPVESVEVTVARGQTVEADLDGCPRAPRAVGRTSGVPPHGAGRG